jgi:hypothetical protein
MRRLGCCLLAVATAHAFVATQPLPWAQVSALAPGASPRALRVSPYTLAMAKKKGKDEVKSVSSAAAPTRSAAAIIADVRQALAESGNGFQSSAADLERVAALLGTLEDQNGVCPAMVPRLGVVAPCPPSPPRAARSHCFGTDVENPSRSSKLWGEWRLLWTDSKPMIKNRGGSCRQ